MVLIACFEHTTILYERIILPIKLNQQLVPQAGLKPATYGLEDRYSIQLSYWGK